MDELPMLSIILPVYNVSAYLCRCMDILLNESFTDYEIILVDDGSTDSCPKICDQYRVQDKRVRVIHKSNGGLSSARNSGLSIARGRYIFWVDPDDYITVGALAIIGELLNSNKADILKFNYVRQPNGVPNTSCVKSGYYTKQDIEDVVLPMALTRTGEYILSAWSHVYRKVFLDKNSLRFVSEREIGSEDYLFNFQALLAADSLYAAADVLYNYEYRPGSLSQRRSKLTAQYKRLYDMMRHALAEHNATDAQMRMLQYFYVWNCYYVLIPNEMDMAKLNGRKIRNKNIRQLLRQDEFVSALSSVKTRDESPKRRVMLYLMRSGSLNGILFLKTIKRTADRFLK